MLNLPEAVTPVFLAVYIGLQIGLPDSFRTGNNSTDNFVFAILLNDIYEKKFANEVINTEEEEENQGEIQKENQEEVHDAEKSREERAITTTGL